MEGFNSVLATLRGLRMGVGTRFAVAAAAPGPVDPCGVASVGRPADAWIARVGAGWNESFLIGTGPGSGSGLDAWTSGELV